MKKRPPRLKKGDTIGIIAPASPPRLEDLRRSFEFLHQIGLKWKLGQSVERVDGYLAGTDSERLRDVQDMFLDESVQGIICASGGYGSARFVDQIDWKIIQDHPKVFWGYSDITYLHNAMQLHADLVTFHGPMLATCVGKDTFHPLSAQMFQQLFEPTEISYTEKISPLQTVSGAGVVQGELIGGNLSLLVSTLGTSNEIQTARKIVLIEDIGEEPYQVDKMLNQLRLAGKFEQVAGIVIGNFAQAAPKKRTLSWTLEQVFQHYFGQLEIPVVKGFQIGHCEPHIAIPLGTEARLDATNRTLTILPGVQ